MVKYDNMEYPGEVTAIGDGEYKENVLHRSGKSWKWPNVEDHVLYAQGSILRNISGPVELQMAWSTITHNPTSCSTQGCSKIKKRHR